MDEEQKFFANNKYNSKQNNILYNNNVFSTLETVTISNSIIPTILGTEIGDGILAYKTVLKKSDLEKNEKEIFKLINKYIPGDSGKNRAQLSRLKGIFVPKKYSELIENINDILLPYLGALSKKDDFIKILYDDEEYIWIVVNSRSREVSNIVSYYHSKEINNYNLDNIEKAKLFNLTSGYSINLSSEKGQNYVSDLWFCIDFAFYNRLIIAIEVYSSILDIIGTDYYMQDIIIHIKEKAIDQKHFFIEKNDSDYTFKKGLAIKTNNREGIIIQNNEVLITSIIEGLLDKGNTKMEYKEGNLINIIIKKDLKIINKLKPILTIKG